jgi:hypothetical protein
VGCLDVDTVESILYTDKNVIPLEYFIQRTATQAGGWQPYDSNEESRSRIYMCGRFLVVQYFEDLIGETLKALQTFV